MTCLSGLNLYEVCYHHLLGANENGTFSVDLSSFRPGSHVLTVTATSTDGRANAHTLRFTVTELPGKIEWQSCQSTSSVTKGCGV